MAEHVTIRPYRGADEAALLALWNETLTHDRIDAARFRCQVLLDANFDPAGLLLAEAGGRLAGFLLSIARQTPLLGQGMEPELAWITAFGVRSQWQRQGVGRQLFTAALSRLASQGRQRVRISPYTPNYFTPGVDVAAYPAALAFLQGSGWQVISQPISMQVDLTGFQVPPEVAALEAELAQQGIAVRPVQAADLPALMPFIVRHFGWDWFRFAQELLLQQFGPGSDELCFLVATRGAEIVGYCQQRRERFGPFGVDPALRGRGIGRLLLFRCLDAMLAKGFHCAWFLWTGRNAARVYQQAGFRQVRQFAILERSIA
ncbi:MAG: GNAT family N-acetyltransferase [Anaerolinea sp.]|nr:GNAT family N-acetyltransferase [Anaerolinea sp.]